MVAERQCLHSAYRPWLVRFARRMLFFVGRMHKGEVTFVVPLNFHHVSCRRWLVLACPLVRSISLDAHR
jgi:hypothetical protein